MRCCEDLNISIAHLQLTTSHSGRLGCRLSGSWCIPGKMCYRSCTDYTAPTRQHGLQLSIVSIVVHDTPYTSLIHLPCLAKSTWRGNRWSVPRYIWKSASRIGYDYPRTRSWGIFSGIFYCWLVYKRNSREPWVTQPPRYDGKKK